MHDASTRAATIAELWARAIVAITEIERRELAAGTSAAAEVLPGIYEAASRSTAARQAPYSGPSLIDIMQPPDTTTPRSMLAASAARDAATTAAAASPTQLADRLREYADGLENEGRHRGPQWMREAARRLAGD